MDKVDALTSSDVEAKPPIIGDRYRLLTPVGTGGMGAVHVALDRLTGKQVALKQVLAQAETLEFASRASNSTNLAVALAQEFEILASLRHPNIISVLDYGFSNRADNDPQPFYTMDLLSDAKSITDAGADLNTEGKVDLLVQLLRALGYLHRRGLLHRDLKPTNVLVANNTVRVVDFGLSIDTEHTQQQELVGTMHYIAPEIFLGSPASPASDLYAVGSIAYQMLTGKHPFQASSLVALVYKIGNALPDLSPFDGMPKLKAVIARLLAKRPDERQADASEAIRDLYAALDKPPALETRETRESFLQAARLVGRESEMRTLTEALRSAAAGNGGAWLIAGESGIGKSRLMNEIRTRALVQGLIVSSGQATTEGSAPFEPWQAILRRLALGVPLSDMDAGVLKTVIPDIAALLERPIPDPPPVSGTLSHARLFRTIERLIGAQQTPLLILLEDIHWADSESLSLFGRLSKFATTHPVLLLANYRDDEGVNVLAQLPELPTLKLNRLTDDAIQRLTASMIGPASQRGNVIDLLKTETEGNVYFLVEVLRALAEEVGELDQIGVATLPKSVFSGGIQRILERRLNRILPEDRPLLELAAVVGRVIDIPVLQNAMSGENVSDWLLRCGDAAVLEVNGGRWRFAHDKLREQTLRGLADSNRRVLHEQVASAIERVYADQLAPHYGDLAHHFGKAGLTVQERYYVRLAGEQAAAQFANFEALNYFSRALALADPADSRWQFEVTAAREEVLHIMGNRTDQETALNTMAALAESLGDAYRAKAALRRANQQEAMGNFAASVDAGLQAAQFAAQAGDLATEIQAEAETGHSLQFQTRMEEAQTLLLSALAKAQRAGLRSLEAKVCNNLGSYYLEMHQYEVARQHLDQALLIARETGSWEQESDALGNIGIIYAETGQAAEAEGWMTQAMLLAHNSGDQMRESRALNNLGSCANQLGDPVKELMYYEQALVIDREIENQRGELILLYNLATLQMDFGLLDDSRANYERALAYFERINERRISTHCFVSLSHLAYFRGETETAAHFAEKARAEAEDLKLLYLVAMAYERLGDVHLQANRLAEAETAYLRAIAAETEDGLRMIPQLSLSGAGYVRLLLGDIPAAMQHYERLATLLAERGQRIDKVSTTNALRCYRILAAAGDPRAESLLAERAAFLLTQAEKIHDEDLHQSMLEKGPGNRELLDVYNQLRRKSDT